MFGRKNATAAASDALDTVSPYVDQLAHDEKLRQRLVAALTAGAAARTRAKRQSGLIGLATRLATDPVLRAQVAEATTQLQKANSRLKKHKSHKVRNAMLLLAGAGAVVAAIPSLREPVPAASLWPFISACAIGVVFVASIFSPWALTIGVVPCAIAIAAWFWPKELKRHPEPVIT